MEINDIGEGSRLAQGHDGGDSGPTLVALFEYQAAQTPDHLAVMNSERSLTFYELDRRSNQLARFLRQRGVRRGTPTAVSLERSPELLIAIWSILKAGGVYLPLDHTYPAERLRYILDDAAAPLIVSQHLLASQLPIDGLTIVLLDDDWALISGQDGSSLRTPLSPHDSAYIIYTSGSTGWPKGVTVEHGAIVSHCMAILADYGYTAHDRVLQFSSISFDAALEQLFPPLLCGATIVLRDPDGWDALQFHHAIGRLGLTIVDIPTAYWQYLGREWAALPKLEPAAHLRLIVVGGETMRLPALRFWQRTSYAPIRLLNAYGPTEATITSLVFDVTAPHFDAQREQGHIPIGHPLGWRTITILGPDGRPMPAGETGEIAIGGELLARGYLNRPALTAEKFIPDPFAHYPGARIYKTGDLGRTLAAGAIEFLGRMDDQVKVRGYRVELDEIEQTLNQHPAVENSVVAARTSEDGETHIIAYVVPSATAACEDHAALSATLFHRLQQRLPSFMYPSSIEVLSEFVLSPSGKIDRQALPAPQVTAPSADVALPQTLLQMHIGDIWQEILNIAHVGLNDNFFALGGHSLAVMQCISRVRNTLGIELVYQDVFTHPTVAELSRLIDKMRKTVTEQPIRPAPRSQPFPLSFVQQQLWLLEQLIPGTPAYHIAVAIELDGPLEPAWLEAAIHLLAERHESLRTAFVLNQTEPVQLIRAEVSIPLVYHNLEALPADSRAREAARLSADAARRPFDLTQAPLLRALLLHLGSHQHLCVLTMHHGITDGWSVNVLLAELAEIYDMLSTQRLPALAPLQIQYADFAWWQRQQLRNEREAQLAYWRQHLAGAPLEISLPLDRPRPAIQALRGDCYPLTIDLATLKRLKGISQDEGVTLFMTLLAIFQVLLHRYSGQEEIIVGAPMANRTRKELEGLVGFFANMLPLRTTFVGNPTFSELFQQVRKTALDAYAHQETPFERIIEALQPERDLSRNPVVQVVFALHDHALPALKAGGLSFSPQMLSTGTARFDLILDLNHTSDGLVGWIEYNTDIFDRTSITRMGTHLQALIDQATHNPKQRIGWTSLLNPVEQQRLTPKMRNVDVPRISSVVRLVEEQAARSSNRPAIISAGLRITYGEINRRANQLASHLSAYGIGPETLVCVCFERSPELIIVLLATLKAGGAYLPLDPTAPSERIRQILDDSGACLLLADSAHPATAVLWRGLTLYGPTLWDAAAKYPSENRNLTISGEQLAYVITTSGSTGTPKGVEIEHASLLNLVLWHQQAFELNEDSRCTLIAAPNFDASVWEIWSALTVGACLAIPSSSERVVAEQLRDWLVASEITHSFVPTPLTEQLMALDWPASTHLRTLLTGGDRLRRYPPRGLPFAVINNYGPTEATVVASSGETLPHMGEERLPGIGTPITNIYLYIVDQYGNPAPIGVPGELLIGGSGLARGYRNRPSLTAAAFIPDHLSGQAGTRLYQTGDRARLLADGSLEFLGRTDHQVKIRGFRIESGEIEAVLLESPAVDACVVVAREGNDGEQSLVAWVTLVHGDAIHTRDLRAWLAARLPQYMIPSAFLIVETLPLTSSGKFDIGALQQHEEQTESLEKPIPASPLEEVIAGIWENILGHRAFGFQDNFFELGGHSLTAAQVIARIAAAFGVQLDLSIIFDAPTVVELAQRVYAALLQGRQIKIESIPTALHDEAVPVSYQQERRLRTEIKHPLQPRLNVAVAWHIEGALNVQTVERVITEIVRRHNVLRTNFRTTEDGFVQVFRPPTALAATVVDLTPIEPDQRMELVHQRLRLEAWRPFDLARDVLLRLVIMKLDSHTHIISVWIDHYAADGWSLGLFCQEFAALYASFSRELPSPLAELPIQFADFALWQRSWLIGEQRERLLSYWREQLAGGLHFTLPLDLPGDPRQTAVGAEYRHALSPSLGLGLHEICRMHGVTLFMALLSAFTATLSFYTGAKSIELNVPTSNRVMPQVESLIGNFSHFLVLKVSLAGDPTFKEFLSHVREVTLGAYVHQALPYEVVKGAIPGVGGQNRVFFTFDNFQLEPPRLPGLQVTEIQIESDLAGSILGVSVTENEGVITLAALYKAELLKGSTVRRLIGGMEVLLQALITNPTQRLSSVWAWIADAS